MKQTIFPIFFILLATYANAQSAAGFDAVFKQWATDNKWGTNICQVSRHELKAMFSEYTS